ncbi:MAG: DegT/DnrJ/EryC1/StrS family aminotransferase [Acidobacteriota bacterium]
MKNPLAINGGKALRHAAWPRWPRKNPSTDTLLNEVFENGRWTNSGPWAGAPLLERRFADAFAKYCGTGFCVPTDHGSSALVVALEALDVGFGDEVIVPAITWVANATTVANINAVPVIVDVDPDSLCLAPDATRQAITERTRAIVPVHLYCGVANLDDLAAISRDSGVPLIEDCAHVHGAAWRGRPVGSYGIAGTFSMQQSKVLTCGEGGAVVTSNPMLARRMEQLRADARVYTGKKLTLHDMELVQVDEIQGTNYCLSEFHAAILLAQLERLEEDHERRARNASHLDSLLAGMKGVAPLRCLEGVTRRVFYCYVMRCKSEYFAGHSVEAICRALSAELGIPFFPTYTPLTRVPSYKPESKRRFHISKDHLQALTTPRFKTPNAEYIHRECICFPHWALLSNEKDMEDIAMAIEKVQRQAASIPSEA